ncbi:hypothetical protein PHLGIDRAFT_122858 [Phlebiopsis gigantea 11061_1 CR5-6]|uniref:Uncharacterized protein n=1 Tax=Phlebiopsis gigantea (strain 11061_1 CR5-6) TaxID=745531 RepID=A0A0C3RZP3_PHLG1|nr:hypothetical protein PHLGIDRAFT_122858 [Phlebiopsis gigantea 11061_1 CR5-6]
MAGLSLAFFTVLGMLLSLLLYGMYLITFIMSTYYLWRKAESRKTVTNNLLISANILLFLLTTAQTIVGIHQVVSPFASDVLEVPLRELFATAVSAAEDIASLALFIVELIVSDAFLIYRLWVVYSQDWRIVAMPACALVLAVVSESIFVNNASRVTSEEGIFGSAGDALWLMIGLICDVFVNVYCTVSISIKIWRSQRRTRDATRYLRSTSAVNILTIIIESATLYTACMLSMLISYACGSLGGIIMIDLAAPVIGLAFCLIIIRFGMGGAFSKNTQPSAGTISSSQGSNLRRVDVIVAPPLAPVYIDRDTLKDTIDTLDSPTDRDSKVNTIDTLDPPTDRDFEVMEIIGV